MVSKNVQCKYCVAEAWSVADEKMNQSLLWGIGESSWVSKCIPDCFWFYGLTGVKINRKMSNTHFERLTWVETITMI